LNAYSIDNVQIVADGLDHPECVAWHPDGSLWAGGEAGQIYRIDPKGRVEEVANTGGFILGLAFSPDCEWLAICDLRKRCVWRLDIDNLALDIFSTGAEDHSFNIPNFPCFDRSGSLYVSESGAFRTTTGKVLRFDSAGYGEVWSDGPFNFANGLALSPDEKHLYVVSSFLPGIERVAIAANGSAGRREVVVELPGTVPDGIAFDAAGDLYISCYAPNAIYRLGRNGKLDTVIDDWEAHTLCNPTNIAFGGTALDSLFFANLGRWHVGKIDIGIPGLKLACHY